MRATAAVFSLQQWHMHVSNSLACSARHTSGLQRWLPRSRLHQQVSGKHRCGSLHHCFQSLYRMIDITSHACQWPDGRKARYWPPRTRKAVVSTPIAVAHPLPFSGLDEPPIRQTTPSQAPGSPRPPNHATVPGRIKKEGGWPIPLDVKPGCECDPLHFKADESVNIWGNSKKPYQSAR